MSPGKMYVLMILGVGDISIGKQIRLCDSGFDGYVIWRKMYIFVILGMGEMSCGENAHLRDTGGGGYVNWGKCTAT